MKHTSKSYFHLLILLLVSSTTIIAEISLSRLFSYMLSYHFVFIIIAFTLFGLGVGEIMYYRSDRIKNAINTFYTLLPFSIFLSYLLLILLNKIYFFSTPSTSIFINILLSTLPFVNIGIVKSDIFQKEKSGVSWFYGMDLVGSAGGAMLSVIILNNLGLRASFFVSYLVLVVAVVLWLFAFNKGEIKSRTVVLWSILILASGWFGFYQLAFDPAINRDNNKDMLRLLNNPMTESKIVASEWNSFGKTDLVEFAYPDDRKEYIMFIDGAAGSEMVSIETLENDSIALMHKLAHFPATFELNFLDVNQRDTALIIGPGGGIDIVAAWFMDFKVIDAVEVNPSFVRLMKQYNPSTFVSKDNINVYVHEGRNFIRNVKNKYDAVMLTIPVTKGGRGADFYGLTENYLFTVEAVKDYLDALTEEGRLIFTMHNRMEAYRMLSNYLKLMNENGTDSQSAMKNVLIYSNEMNSVLVIKKSPFTMENIRVQHALAHEFGFDKNLLFFPYIEQITIDTVLEDNTNFQWYMFDKLLYGISQNRYDYPQISKASLLNLTPVHDDSPFFFNYENGIPGSLMTFFLVSLLIIGWVVYRTIKGWRFSEQLTAQTKHKYKFLLYMVILLGLAYFFLQAYMFQVLNLQLSNPAQSFSILLFTFLTGNALGSFYTSFFKKNIIFKVSIYSLAIVIAIFIIKHFIVPLASENELPLSILVTILIIPSFLIGIPYPALLREVSNDDTGYMVPLMLGVSSLVSVASSVLVIVISLLWGYTNVLWLGIAGYLIIFIATINFRTKHADTGRK